MSHTSRGLHIETMSHTSRGLHRIRAPHYTSLGLLPAMLLALLASPMASTTDASCTSDWQCSLNGVCTNHSCVCDPAWHGPSCSSLSLAPGSPEGVAGKPLCVYHGADDNSTSWGGSVLQAPEDSKYYMWVAEMINHCGLGTWRSNSAVSVATHIRYLPLPSQHVAHNLLQNL